jgi:hypothetical protein
LADFIGDSLQLAQEAKKTSVQRATGIPHSRPLRDSSDRPSGSGARIQPDCPESGFPPRGR